VPCATDDPSNERVQRSERHGIEDDQGDQGNRANQDNGDEFRTGNGRNEVVLHNCTDDRLRVRAAIQLNTIAGRVVKPLNEAYAEGSCTHCQTLVVALQVDLYDERATDIEPQNYAIAINNDCQHCVTVALAIQYAQAEEHPRDVAGDISDTVSSISDTLAAIQRDPTISLADAEASLNVAIARFNELGGALLEQRDERDSED